MENHISIMQKRKTTLGQRTFMTRNLNDKELLKRGSQHSVCLNASIFSLSKFSCFIFSAVLQRLYGVESARTTRVKAILYLCRHKLAELAKLNKKGLNLMSI